MSNKEQHHGKESRKPATMTLKERRAAKHAKRQPRDIPVIVPHPQH